MKYTYLLQCWGMYRIGQDDLLGLVQPFISVVIRTYRDVISNRNSSAEKAGVKVAQNTNIYTKFL